MASELLILVRGEAAGYGIAVLWAGQLVEYHYEPAERKSLVGAVIVGRVERVLPAAGAAFVNIGQERSGFLPTREQDSFHETGGANPLVSGKEVLVQVKKDAHGGKGAFLTRDIALAGQYGLWMPLNRYIGVSKRITEEQQRSLARDLGRSLTNGEAGMIVRHSALAARFSEVASEVEHLKVRWEEITQRAPYQKPPAILFRESTTLQALLRDYAVRYHVLLQTEGDALPLMQVEELGQNSICWEKLTSLQMEAAWRAGKVEAQLHEALQRTVYLPQGGSLVVDEREALTTIDVNTAAFIGKAQEDMAFSQNLAACSEIARHIRLRNISGILLIDFMDMRTQDQQEQVAKALSDALAQDRIKSVVHGFTALGLLEMTRKRTQKSLREVLCEPCTSCKGEGWQIRSRNFADVSV